MPWEEEQERLTQEARLNAASPEEVFRELKRTAPKSLIERLGRDKALEVGLVERNDPLINLGLASYGTNEEVFTALYKHGSEKPADAADERYKLGLRIGCLSNRSVRAFDLPRQLIGPEEIHRVLAAGEDAEAEALICNPSVSDRLLEELYKRTDAVATLPEERWLQLIYMSRKNERLVTKEDDDYSPDTGHYSIHRAIFHLLETAPVHIHCLRDLYGLLDQLDFQQVASPETIEAALSRWAKLDDKFDGKPMEGYFTTLSIKEEFRCLIAALYGSTWSNSELSVQGSPSAKDVAMRCAYYGNAQLSERQMKAGYNRDGGEYLFATMYNKNLFSNGKLRKLFEEEQLGWRDDQFLARYLRNFELVRKKWPYLESFLPNDVQAKATNKGPMATGLDEKAVVRAVETAANRIAARISHQIYIAVLVIVGIYLVYHYGLTILGFLAAVVYMIGQGVGILK